MKYFKNVNNKKVLLRLVIAFTLLSGLLVMFIVLKKDSVIQYALDRANHKIKDKFDVQIKIKKNEVHSFTTISLYEIGFFNHKNVEIGKIDQIDISLDVFSLLTLKIKPSQVVIMRGYLKLFEKLDSLKKHPKDNVLPDKSITKKENIFKKTFGLINKSMSNLKNIPDHLEIHDFRFSKYNVKDTIPVEIHKFKYHGTNFHFEGSLNHSPIFCKGKLDKSSKSCQIEMLPKQNKVFRFPIIENKDKVYASFARLFLSMKFDENGNDGISFTSKIEADHPTLYHKRINKDTFQLKQIAYEGEIYLDHNTFTVDSLSKITVNQYVINPYLNVRIDQSKKKDTIVHFRVKSPLQEIQRAIQAVPTNAFTSVQNMKIEGKWAHELDIKFRTSALDDLIFQYHLTKDKIRIKSLGNSGLRKLNSEFTHYTHRNNRKIIVGTSNPSFTPFDRISDYLKQSILLAEDGGFFWHQGFYLESFQGALIENLKKKRFRRGGSTISMQLVKNVFLGHEKTIFRKLEEIFLVWLIESQRICSKKRMYEVYMNIIEWGPNIFGVQDACWFYFRKLPIQLTIEESIFLAMIIPHPRAFRFHFEDGTTILRPFNEPFFQLIGKKLLHRKIISESQLEDLNCLKVRLKGAALEYVLKRTKKAIMEKAEINMIKNKNEN